MFLPHDFGKAGQLSQVIVRGFDSRRYLLLLPSSFLHASRGIRPSSYLICICAKFKELKQNISAATHHCVLPKECTNMCSFFFFTKSKVVGTWSCLSPSGDENVTRHCHTYIVRAVGSEPTWFPRTRDPVFRCLWVYVGCSELLVIRRLNVFGMAFQICGSGHKGRRRKEMRE
jgi:hypothetical protein